MSTNFNHDESFIKKPEKYQSQHDMTPVEQSSGNPLTASKSSSRQEFSAASQRRTYEDLNEGTGPIRHLLSLQQPPHPRIGYNHTFPTLAELQLRQEVVRLAREVSRLKHERDMERREAEIQSTRADFYRAESIRLRNERDMERAALASLQKHYDVAQARFYQRQRTVSEVSSSYEKISAPILDDIGAMISSIESVRSVEGSGGFANKHDHLLGASWLEDNRTSMTNSTLLVKPRGSTRSSPQEESTS